MSFCPGSCACAVSTFIPASGSFFSPAAAAAAADFAASISAAVCNVTIAILSSLLLIQHGSNATHETHRYRYLPYRSISEQPQPPTSRQHCSSSSSRRSPPESHPLRAPSSESSPVEATAPSQCPYLRSPEPGRSFCPSPTP